MSNTIAALQTAPLSLFSSNPAVDAGQPGKPLAKIGLDLNQSGNNLPKSGAAGASYGQRQVQQGFLAAGGGTPSVPPTTTVRSAPAQIKTWVNDSLPAVKINGSGTPTLTAQTGRPTLVPAPAIPVVTKARGQNLQNSIFPPGSQVLTVRDVPQLDPSKMSVTKRQAIEKALTDSVINQFNQLSPAQQTLARTWLSAVFEGMTRAPNESGYIATAQLPAAIKYVISQAGEVKVPAGEATQQGGQTQTSGAGSKPPPPALPPTPARTTTTPSPPQKPLAPTLAPTPEEAPPPTQARSVASAGSGPAWSDEQIRGAVNTLAQQRGITRPSAIALMTDTLQYPSSTVAQRGARLGLSEATTSNNTAFIQKSLGFPNEKGELRIRLAELTGMPLAALVSRIGSESDPNLGSRVIGRIAPRHREDVARRLLSVKPDSELEPNRYRMLETMFTSDPFTGRDGSIGNLSPLFRAFSSDPIEMLRMMGFNAEQILSMNPVGRELAKRIDPAMGTYSKAEASQRKAKGLPTTREEVAMRLLTANTNDGKGGTSYRQWVAVGLLSDKPWSMPQDLNDAYLSVAPGGSPNAGRYDASRAFLIAEQLLGRDIPRGSQPELMDRDYRHDVNRQMLQAFGLGATSLSTGKLESIPTTFEPRDRPNANETGERSAPPIKEPREAQPVDWPELLPLLQRTAR